MSSEATLEIKSNSYDDTLVFARTLGSRFKGGEAIELIGDIGAGKTAFVRGLAAGIKSPDMVQSPTFTISRIYRGPKVEIHHYDFHRLTEPGVLAEQLAESLLQPRTVTVVEWGKIAGGILPKERLQIKIKVLGVHSRKLLLAAYGQQHQQLIKNLQ